jgi:hypothetical protein
MAKQSGTLKAGLAAAKKLQGQMADQRKAEYKTAASALRAGSQNLANQTQVFGRQLVIETGKNQAALAAIAARGSRQSGVVARGEARARTAYGSAMGGVVGQAFSTARTSAAQTGKLSEAGQRFGNVEKMTAQGATQIAQAGVQATQAAAKYALAQALAAKTMVDNQTIANLEGSLYQTALQYNEQWKMWKKQQNYAAKQAAGSQMSQTVNTLTNEAPQLGVDAWKLYRDQYAAAGNDPSGIDVNKAVTDWASHAGYAADGPEAAVMRSALQKMIATGVGPNGGIDTTQVMTQAVQTVYGGLPGWDKYGAPLLNAIQSGTSAAFTAAFQNPQSHDFMPGGPSDKVPVPVLAQWVTNQTDKNAAMAYLKQQGYSDDQIQTIFESTAGLTPNTPSGGS